MFNNSNSQNPYASMERQKKQMATKLETINDSIKTLENNIEKCNGTRKSIDDAFAEFDAMLESM